MTRLEKLNAIKDGKRPDAVIDEISFDDVLREFKKLIPRANEISKVFDLARSDEFDYFVYSDGKGNSFCCDEVDGENCLTFSAPSELFYFNANVERNNEVKGEDGFWHDMYDDFIYALEHMGWPMFWTRYYEPLKCFVDCFYEFETEFYRAVDPIIDEKYNNL